jgi:hypothetical protein
VVRIDIPEEFVQPEVLREAIAGRVPQVPPSSALDLILELDIPPSDQQELLSEVVRDANLEPYLRAGAVRAHLRMGTAADLATLLEALASPEELVAAAAAAVLGQVGGPDVLSSLRNMRDRAGGEIARRQASFAEALIVHRYRITDRDVELPSIEAMPAPVGVGALSFVSVRPGRERRARALEGIRKEFSWLDSARQDVYEVQCGQRLLEVAVDAEVGGPDGRQALLKDPALLAIVAFRSVEYDEFYAGLLVLSRPRRTDGVTLLLTRLTGEPVYVAEGSVTGSEAEFELLAVQGPGAIAVAARIRLTAGGVEIAGVSDRRATPSRSPERIDPPS